MSASFRGVSTVIGLAFSTAALAAALAGPARLVEMERQFARDAATHGTRAAFLAHLSPRGIVFTDQPVNGVELWSPRPNGKSRLLWEPDVAAISSGGDIGWTSGPWWWRPDSAARPLAFGRYFTIWQREGDTWKAVLDGGIKHDSLAPPTTVGLHTLRAPKPARRADAEATLTAAEDAYAAAAAQEGMAAAVRRFGDPEVMVLRARHRAFNGVTAASDSLSRLETRGAFTRAALAIGAAGDMGYSYGALVSGGGTVDDSSSYVHVWHRRPTGAWAMAVEVRIPIR